MLDLISANSLRGHLSFIASDLLEGRDTPSAGLEIAAQYIAAQFRRAGLEPAGDAEYFQNASFFSLEQAKEGFTLRLQVKEQAFEIAKRDLSYTTRRALALSNAPVVVMDATSKAFTPKRESVEGKVVVIERPNFRGPGGRELYGRYQSGTQSLGKLNLSAILVVDRNKAPEREGRPAIIEASSPEPPPQVILRGKIATDWFSAIKADASGATVSLRMRTPIKKPLPLHNVIGVLPGSDPVLKNTYILLTAHYDHVGVKAEGSGDRIFNGANDDGSGTVSVIELASALSSMHPRPKRSIVFMTFFGEERGLLGSQYYAQHPIFPLSDTIADVNLEHVGRTDSTEGKQIANGTFTGADYSDVPEIFKAAGEKTGIRIYTNQMASDDFFAASDNISLAVKGVPAHSFCVAFEFPDYHAVGDEWDKIDYENMANVDRMLAAGLIELANRPNAPQWNDANRRTEPFVKAWKELHKQ